MHTFPGFALLGLLVTATPAPQPFGAWFDARVKAEKPEVRERFQQDLDGDGQEDDVACYDFKAPEGPGTTPPVILVGLATGERFAMRGDGLGPIAYVGCPSAPSSKPKDRPGSLHLGGNGLTGYAGAVSLRFDRKGPLLVGGETGDRYHAWWMDLISQRTELSSYEYSEAQTEDPVPARSAAMLASGTQAPAPAAPVWVSWGKKNWSGDADAGLKAQWLRKDSTVTLIATLQDDQPVPATDASAKAILAADHLELWWSEPNGESTRAVQLGVARTAEGKPVATWFQPPGRKSKALPALRWTAPGRFEVDLPVSGWVPKPREGVTVHDGDVEPPSALAAVTVVFSDSDGKGQETLVSTTEQRPGATVFSSLYLAEPGSLYPRLSRGVFNWVPLKQATTLRELVLE
ncbi:hypothetical protein JYK02_18690 [Corallococcus macrosporus]|uniref:VCBS repeat-containing protein n=1 Tax=Corallococcus macrosporus TaxID=35 RepID=A0ABS3DFE3_9BACT|nr:hypothetical protein [Corallococcus macrosporus]MBN8229540.1 hypothetical protein [Corallococcus macrosporus]